MEHSRLHSLGLMLSLVDQGSLDHPQPQLQWKNWNLSNSKHLSYFSSHYLSKYIVSQWYQKYAWLRNILFIASLWGTTQSLWGILSHIIHFSHMSNWMNVDVPKAISRNSVSFTMVYWALTSKTSQFRTFEPNPITLWKIIENMSIKNCNDSIIYQIPLSIKTRIKSSYILIAIPLCVMLLHILQVIFIDLILIGCFWTFWWVLLLKI